MRIGLDVRYLSHGLTGGVRNYVYHLAHYLPAAAPAHQFLFYADHKGDLELDATASNVIVRTLPWRSLLSSVVNDSQVARWMERDVVDVAHYPANYGPKGRYGLVVTVHDALNLFPLREHLRGFGKRPRQVALMAYLGYKTRRALREADSVITVSSDARCDIARRSGRPEERIVVVHEAASDLFRVVNDPGVLTKARERFGLMDLVVLADGIKNPQAAIDAFHALPEDVRGACQLVFFSREAQPRAPVAGALGLPGIRFLARPATDDLVLLMNLASVFVFPSWYEGFGLPLVEAMQCGTPVIASSRGSIPEVLGGAGLLFDLEEPDAFARHLLAVLDSEAIRSDLRARSLARARAFSWQTTAERTVEVYRQALARRAASRP